MATKRTGRPRGRPSWDLRTDGDRWLIGAFWATQFFEKATRHSVAMTYAAVELGELARSSENDTVRSSGRGKLEFGVTISQAQYVSNPKGHSIKKRADDILRKANRALRDDIDWTQAMAAAFMLAFYHADREYALLTGFVNCMAISEGEFFEQSLRPFIIGRFDPSKRVSFSLPDFMPNFS